MRLIHATIAISFMTALLTTWGCAKKADIPADSSSKLDSDPGISQLSTIAFSKWEGKTVDWGQPPEKKLYATNSLLNLKAPNLVIEKWLSETPEMAGKFVLIDYWATWCPPCRKAIPELNEISKEFASELVVIGLSDETEENVRAMAEPVIEYYSAIDTQARTKTEIGVQGIPHIVLIDPSGTVCWQGFPMDDQYPLSSETIKGCIERYQAE